MPGIWGSTQITAAGLVRFYAAVKRDAAVWPWLSRAMHDYQPLSAAGEPNAFGLAAADPSAAVKNGWDTNRDVAHPTNAIVNSTGYVDGDRYAVAILSEGPGSLYLQGGEAIVTDEAKTLFAPRTEVASSAPLVVLDPGHNGGNASHLAAIDRLVPAGYGMTKPCNTTGTETDAGYAEHAFTWDVAKRVEAILRRHAIRVLLTRSSDTGVGPCVNERAAIESTAGVAAAIAIHADGGPASGHGFHICVDSRRPVGASAATVARTQSLDTALHETLTASSGLVPSTYIGSDGYFHRDDLAGLNLSTAPTAFLELGNMRNAHDAALQSSPSGRARIATAVAAGILAYLHR
jgi:N-acetylmuramoyl-L-alanine amidase